MYTIYRLDTGQIKRVSETPNNGWGEGIIGGSYDPSSYRVVNGKAVPLPPPPSIHEKEFDFLLERWVRVAGQDPRPILSERDRLLSKSDWTDTLSAKARMGDALYEQWQTYRQALRDIPEQAGYPMDVVWPEPPKQVSNKG